MTTNARVNVGQVNGTPVIMTGHVQDQFRERNLGIPNVLAVLNAGEIVPREWTNDKAVHHRLETLVVVTERQGDALVVITSYFEGENPDKVICRMAGRPVTLSESAKVAMGRTGVSLPSVTSAIRDGESRAIFGRFGETVYEITGKKAVLRVLETFDGKALSVVSVKSATPWRKPPKAKGAGNRKQARRMSGISDFVH